MTHFWINTATGLTIQTAKAACGQIVYEKSSTNKWKHSVDYDWSNVDCPACTNKRWAHELQESI